MKVLVERGFDFKKFYKSGEVSVCVGAEGDAGGGVAVEGF